MYRLRYPVSKRASRSQDGTRSRSIYAKCELVRVVTSSLVDVDVDVNVGVVSLSRTSGCGTGRTAYGTSAGVCARPSSPQLCRPLSAGQPPPLGVEARVHDVAQPVIWALPDRHCQKIARQPHLNRYVESWQKGVSGERRHGEV